MVGASLKYEQTILPDSDDVVTEYSTPQAEVLLWHYQLSHLSFTRIKKLAE
jgi:hypothetical protein